MASSSILGVMILIAVASAASIRYKFPTNTCAGWDNKDTLPSGLSCYTDYDDKIFCKYLRDKTTEDKNCSLLIDYHSDLINYDATCDMGSKGESCTLLYDMPYTFLSFHVMDARLTCRGPIEEVVLTGRFKPSCNIQLYSPTVSCVGHNCSFMSYEHERFEVIIKYMYQISKNKGTTWSEPKILTAEDCTVETTFPIEGLEDGVPTIIKAAAAYHSYRYTHFNQFTTFMWTP